MDMEGVLYVEPEVMNGERMVEKGYSAFQKILIFMGALLAAGIAYKLVKGKTMDAITLPFRFALMLLLLGGFLVFILVSEPYISTCDELLYKAFFKKSELVIY